MGIKNVIFDFGQVMVHFVPEYMVGKYISDKTDARLLEEVVFDRLYWDKLDSGTITDREVTEAFRTRLPERLWEVADTIYYNWIYNIPEVEGMRELVTHIKQRYGARVFLLSNISTYFAEHKDEIPCLAEFEHCVFSAVVGMVKPSKEIFEYICEIGGILPEESLFVDDNAANIAGAEKCGIEGYLFDGDVAALKAYLNSVL
jgi:putative hydrolase of the HAD superfamily